jgi:hypothetical protein
MNGIGANINISLQVNGNTKTETKEIKKWPRDKTSK